MLPERERRMAGMGGYPGFYGKYTYFRIDSNHFRLDSRCDGRGCFRFGLGGFEAIENDSVIFLAR